MTRTEFISEMKSQIENLMTEKRENVISYKKTGEDRFYFKASKLDHEISALENAVRELERKWRLHYNKATIRTWGTRQKLQTIYDVVHF